METSPKIETTLQSDHDLSKVMNLHPELTINVRSPDSVSPIQSPVPNLEVSPVRLPVPF